jgi:VWFA-related protein
MKTAAFALAMMGVLCSLTLGQIRVDVALVNIVATVTDSHGRYVTDLAAEDFIVQEDSRRQNISYFSHSNDLPISVGIVLDTSASMERKMGTATRAVDRFIRDIHPEDDIFLMTFDESPKVRQNFTSDREKLSEALYKVKLGSGTALYDAVIAGIDKLKKAKRNKKAIILISDGVDTSSEHDFAVALLATRESEALVYCLGISAERTARFPRAPISTPDPSFGTPFPLPGPGRRAMPGQILRSSQGMPNLDAVDMTVLDAIAEASAGNSWLITTGEDRTSQIKEALDFIADELRSQYTLSYYPGHPLDDGVWHHVDIRTKNPRYDVRAKKEYYGSDR